MAGIFISYRRADSDGWAGRLRDALRARFGDRVFQDVESIADGEIFSEVIDRALQECDVALVIIGPNWAKASDAAGPRLHHADDWVRTETRLVLERRIRVIPVLVGGAAMPRAEDLPEELRSLTQRQAREIRSNSWDSDVALLTNHLKQIVGAPRKRPVWAYALASMAVIAVGVFAGTQYFSRSIAEGGPAPSPVAPVKSAGSAPAASSISPATPATAADVTRKSDGAIEAPSNSSPPSRAPVSPAPSPAAAIAASKPAAVANAAEQSSAAVATALERSSARAPERAPGQAARAEPAPPAQAAPTPKAAAALAPAREPARTAASMNDWRFSGKVTGRERVRVPAGSFDSIKAELEGELDQSFPSTRDPFNETTASSQTYTVWFVPEVSRAVKYERRTYNRGRRLLDHEQYELVSYRLK